MDFALPPEVDSVRRRIRAFVDSQIIPVEADPDARDPHENINDAALQRLRRLAREQGLWAPQMPQERGGMGLPVVGMAACYEEMNRSIFGPVVFNAAAPDDGNMIVLNKLASEEQKQRWLQPIIDGRVRSAFAMTEPMGCGSDPSLTYTRAEKTRSGWVITGRKWFITGAEGAAHFILIARTSDDDRKGLTRLPVRRRAAGVGDRPAHPGDGPRRARRPLRNRLRRSGDPRRKPPARGRRRPEGDPDPARHGAAHPLHALARHVPTGAGDRRRVHRPARELRSQAGGSGIGADDDGRGGAADRDRPAADDEGSLEAGSGRLRPQGGGDGQDRRRRRPAALRRYRHPAQRRPAATRGTSRSSGCIVMPGRRDWSTAPRKCTGWCCRASCARKASTSGNGERERHGRSPTTASGELSQRRRRHIGGPGGQHAAALRRRHPGELGGGSSASPTVPGRVRSPPSSAPIRPPAYASAWAAPRSSPCSEPPLPPG